MSISSSHGRVQYAPKSKPLNIHLIHYMVPTASLIWQNLTFNRERKYEPQSSPCPHWMCMRLSLCSLLWTWFCGGKICRVSGNLNGSCLLSVCGFQRESQDQSCGAFLSLSLTSIKTKESWWKYIWNNWLLINLNWDIFPHTLHK